MDHTLLLWGALLATSAALMAMAKYQASKPFAVRLRRFQQAGR